ncbi:MAG TPA: zinc-binding alcohol dehydrogenase family protein [Burkholderiales bacterium]
MKAVAHTTKDLDSLVDIELPKPTPTGRDLLVKVEAVSVNPVDTKRRIAPNEKAEPRVLGWDAAGTVAAVGDKVGLFSEGDAVYYAGDVTRPGCNSEFHLVDERIVGRKPKSLDFAQAAAIPLTAITAWEAYFDRLNVQSGKTLLIIGGAGGVGSIGIQLAKGAGLKVIATASRPDSVAWVKEMGADQVVGRDFKAEIRKPVDYIAVYNDIDSHWAAIGELIAPQGGIVSIVGNLKPLAMDAVRAKSASLHWELMFTRSRFQTPDMIEQHKLLNQVAGQLDAGQIKGTLRETLSPINAANLRKVHAQLESGTTIGKLVLKGWQ